MGCRDVLVDARTGHSSSAWTGRVSYVFWVRLTGLYTLNDIATLKASPGPRSPTVAKPIRNQGLR